MACDLALLWKNHDDTIFLVDGPTSIRTAQGHEAHSLISTPAVSKPFPSQEPRSESAKKRLLNTNPSASNDEYTLLLNETLSLINRTYHGAWSLPRVLDDKSVINNDNGVPIDKIEDDSASSLIYDRPITTQLRSMEEATQVQPLCHAEDWPYISNESDEMQYLTVNADCSSSFYVPSRSTFMLADFADKTSIETFHSRLRAQSSEAGTPWKFDYILLDPPWSNKSVKRKRSSYRTAHQLHIVDMLHTMDVDRLMRKSCVVAVWITNKAAVRDAVLGEGGLFEAWGVELIEEWVWLKVTTNGKPISAVDALWRKPYEILLVGRHKCVSDQTVSPDVTRRVLVSVPDLHSRKPCLKSLIESLLPKDYRALEIFARHLVQGWWSWGNECIKFNDTRHWRPATEAA